MNIDLVYEVVGIAGICADEAMFKKRFMKIIEDAPDRYKSILAIENAVEPGMPDLILVDRRNRSVFIETKYARKGVITFKKTQIPWYRKHKNLPIIIMAYNDKTDNVHIINASYITAKIQSLCFTLEKESNYQIKESL